MTEERKWELARTGNIKTTSLHNARIALEVLAISGAYRTVDGEVHVVYANGAFAPLHRNVFRYIRQLIFEEFNYAPTYRALEDILIVIANERKDCFT